MGKVPYVPEIPYVPKPFVPPCPPPAPFVETTTPCPPPPPTWACPVPEPVVFDVEPCVQARASASASACVSARAEPCVVEVPPCYGGADALPQSNQALPEPAHVPVPQLHQMDATKKLSQLQKVTPLLVQKQSFSKLIS